MLARLEDMLISISEPSRLIRIYRSGISRNPNDPVTKFFLGKLFHRLEMIDDSFDTLSGIDTGGASYPELHLLMGNLYMRKRQLEKTVQEFKKAADIKTAFRLPYCCNHCGYRAEDWSGRSLTAGTGQPISSTLTALAKDKNVSVTGVTVRNDEAQHDTYIS